MLPESHPLRQLFTDLIHRNFKNELHLHNPEVHTYVVNLLTEFCDYEQLLKIRNADGKPLHDVGEMLIESDPIYGPAPSFDRERQVRKHIGDYTLFFAGMFPESINHHRLRRQRLENFVSWMKAGKESYYIVSQFNVFEFEKEAPLYLRLCDEFERSILALAFVREELAERKLVPAA